MRNRILRIAIALLAGIIVLPTSVTAWDLSSFSYTPPPYELGKPIVAKIPAQGITRARVLVVGESGYKAVPMEQDGEMFTAYLEFGSYAVIKYAFQVATDSGGVFETKYYTVRQPSSSDAEARIVALDREVNREQAKVNQLENAIFSLKNADPSEIGKQKGRELAKALLALGRQERRLDEVSEQGMVAAREYATRRGLRVSSDSMKSARVFVELHKVGEVEK